MRKIIGIDLDGTICTESTGDDFMEFRKTAIPLPNALKALRKLQEDGWTINIYTGRNIKWNEFTKNWLHKYDVPFDTLTCGKPPCDLYIARNNIKFENNWNEILCEISEKEAMLLSEKEKKETDTHPENNQECC